MLSIEFMANWRFMRLSWPFLCRDLFIDSADHGSSLVANEYLHKWTFIHAIYLQHYRIILPTTIGWKKSWPIVEVRRLLAHSSLLRATELFIHSSHSFIDEDHFSFNESTVIYSLFLVPLSDIQPPGGGVWAIKWSLVAYLPTFNLVACAARFVVESVVAAGWPIN